VRCEIRLFNVAKRIEFHISCRKKGGIDPEGLYVAFPFSLRDGEFRWHYFLTSMTDRSHAAAARFGWGSRVPFLSRVFPAGPVRGEPVSRSFLGPVPENLHLVACRPDAGGQGLILHWRETAGVATSLDVRNLLRGTPFSDFSVVNIIGEKLEAVASEVTFDPFEVRFLKAGLVPGR